MTTNAIINGASITTNESIGGAIRSRTFPIANLNITEISNANEQILQLIVDGETIISLASNPDLEGFGNTIAGEADVELAAIAIQKAISAVSLSETAPGTTTPVVAIVNAYPDAITVYSWDDEIADPLPKLIPELSDPRWVNLSWERGVRAITLTFSNLQSKNLLFSAGIRIRVFIDIAGNVYQSSTGAPSLNGIQSFPPTLSIVPPQYFKQGRILVAIEQMPFNNTGTTSSLAGIERNRIIGRPGYWQYSTHIDTPTKVKFDYDRQNIQQPPINGAMGSLRDFDPATNSISYFWGNYTLSANQKIRFLSIIDAAFIPPPGIGYIADLADINRMDNSLIVRGSIPPILGRLLRLRLLSATIGGQGSNALLCFSSSTQLSSNTWKVQLSYANSLLVMSESVTNANRFLYLSYCESPELVISSTNTLTYEGNPITIFDELNNAVATINPGTPTTFTWTAHGRSVGDKLLLEFATPAGSYPSNIGVQARYIYVCSVVDVNNITVCELPGLPPLSLGTAGSGLTLRFGNNTPVAVTASVSATATVGIVNHGLGNKARVRLTGTTLPGGYITNTSLFVKTFAGNNLTLSGTNDGLPIAFTSAGSGVLCSGTNTLISPLCPIELSEYYLTSTDKLGEYEIRDSPEGFVFPLCSSTTGNILLTALDPVSISGKCDLVAVY